MSKYLETIHFIREQFLGKEFVPLHEPKFNGNEKAYLLETIDSTYVSSVGPFVDKFEGMMSNLSGTSKAVAVVNGTSALQVALRLVGVNNGDEVITQALTFVATVNAILYNNAQPIFIDVDLDTMGLSPRAVASFLEEFGEMRNGYCYNKQTDKKIAACMPMHTFGFPVHLDELITVCNNWKIPIVEDAAESMGSEYKNRPTGSFGKLGVFSFNGNKIITSGGGGAIVTDDLELGAKAKHLTTTAKKPHPYEYVHDDIGYNFRMPNINAALACAQLEQLERFLTEKRILATAYANYFAVRGINFREEQANTKANYWLMCIELENKKDRDLFLKETNDNSVMTRPIWQLIFKSELYADFQKDDQKNALFLEQRIVNIPSNAR
ncbi:LegC family aminotransferase [Cyclobacteriaceae bacterium]|nr:LegC family aminotransferase [Cyclobacteriaceae bacterium]